MSIVVWSKKQKAFITLGSPVVPLLSTSKADSGLASEFRRDQACYTAYERMLKVAPRSSGVGYEYRCTCTLQLVSFARHCMYACCNLARIQRDGEREWKNGYSMAWRRRKKRKKNRSQLRFAAAAVLLLAV